MFSTFNTFKPSNKIIWMIGGSVLFIILCIIIRKLFSETFDHPAKLDNYFKKTKPQTNKVKGESKGETQCRNLAKKIFDKEFIKIRPDFLRNKVTGKNLELDIYNDELKLAIEYDGQQHAKYVPFFHKNYEHFVNQQYRDEIKKMLCEKNGIKLISVPHTIQIDDIETYLRVEARKLGFDV